MKHTPYPILYWYLLFTLSLTSCTSETNEPVHMNEAMERTHPFMYLTEDRRSHLVAHLQTDPMASIYATLQETADSELVEIDPLDWDAKAHGDNGEIAAANAFIAWLNTDESAAERAIAAMDTLTTNWDDHGGWGINIRMPGPLMHYTAAWDLLRATPFLSEEKAAEVEAKLTTITSQFFHEYVLNDATRRLALTITQNNHPIRTAAAIGFVGLAFQEHPEAEVWLDWAVSELAYLLGPDGQYIQADGTVSEGPFYFNYGLAPTVAFFIALENRAAVDRTYSRKCINRSDVEPWAGHGCVEGESFTYTNPMDTDLFRSTMDWSLSMRLPNGNRAPIADSPLRNQSAPAVFSHFGGADYLYWDWASNPSDPFKVKGGFELAITHLAYVSPKPDALPPAWKNRFFLEGGMATFRSGWQSDDRVLLLLGESGSARKTLHDHTDGTSFVMAAYGDLLLTDTGYYKPNDLQNAVTASASAHNLILVDGATVTPKGLLNNWGDADAFIKNTLDAQALAYAEAHQAYLNTNIVRGIAFVRERYFVVADQLSATDDIEREYRFRLHAFAGKDLDGTVTLDTHGPHIIRENGAVAVYTTTTQGACSLEEPEFTEYAAPHVHKLEKEAEHHMVTDSVIRGVAPDFLTVLAPYKTGMLDGPDAALNVTPVPTENGAAWVIVGNDAVDVAWIRDEGASEQLELPTGDVIHTDGAFIVVSLNTDLGLLVRGTKLRLNDTLVCANNDGVVSASP